MPINTVTLVGRLVADPETINTKTGTSVASFALAVDGYSKESPASFIDCKAFKGTADFLLKWAKKGERMAVSGSLQQERWESKEGEKRSKLVVSVSTVDKFDWEKKEEEEPAF